MDINQVGIVLMGSVLGWFLMFAVRRYKVQWGAFASFMAIVFGVSLMSFLYARDLLAYYGIGIFLGFVANMVVRVAGTTAGGRLGEGLLEISGLERKG
jgi:predicted permease